MTNEWTKEQSALLTELVARGMTAEEIRQRIPGKTRNAIIGKVSRLGIKMMSPVAQSRRGVKMGVKMLRGARVSIKKKKIYTKFPQNVFKAILTPDAIEVPVVHEPKTIIDIGTYECRAIVSKIEGAKTKYCAHPVKEGSSYCKEHHKKYYYPAEKNRAKTGRDKELA